MEMCKSVNQGQQHENFNLGLVNIEEESNSSGLSGWLIVEYSTFFIIILLGLRLLARCCSSCCQRLGERQQRMFTEVVNNQSRRYGNTSEMEMHAMGSRLLHPPAQHPAQAAAFLGGEGTQEYEAIGYDDRHSSP